MYEYYVLTVKKATGANKYLVVAHAHDGRLVVYDKYDDLTAALLKVESLNKEL